LIEQKNTIHTCQGANDVDVTSAPPTMRSLLGKAAQKYHTRHDQVCHFQPKLGMKVKTTALNN